MVHFSPVVESQPTGRPAEPQSAADNLYALSKPHPDLREKGWLELDIEKILAQLREELDLVEKAIARIESMGRGGKRSRARPLAAVAKKNRNETLMASSRRLCGLER